MSGTIEIREKEAEAILAKIKRHEKAIGELEEELIPLTALMYIEGKPQVIVEEGSIGGGFVPGSTWQKNRIIKTVTIRGM